MNATNAHVLRNPPSNSTSAISHMPRSAARTTFPLEQRDSSTPDHDSGTAYNHHARNRPPVSFVDGVLINGVLMRVPVAAEQMRHSRVIQRIARLGNATGGFRTFGAGPLLRACMQFNEIIDVCRARQHVLLLRNQLIGFANTLTTTQIARGGSCKDIDAHVHHSDDGSTHLEIHLLIEVPDRSDVQVTDTMIAKMAPLIEQITNGRTGIIAINCIAARQLLCAQLTLDSDSFSTTPAQAGALTRRLVDLHNFTRTDVATVSSCNKEILDAANSVYAAVGAADRRAVQASRHCLLHSSQGAALAIWHHDHHGRLTGRVALPLQIGQSDRQPATPAHTSTCFAAEATRKVHSIEHAAAAVALAQSLAGLHAHATEAIVRSNPAQHAHDLALLAGARGSEIQQLVRAMLTARALRFDHAITLLDGMRA